jgi:hypothetical protein
MRERAFRGEANGSAEAPSLRMIQRLCAEFSANSYVGPRTRLSGVMRTATTDEHARRWFRRYWTFGVGSGAHQLVNGLLDVTREMAEQDATSSGS